MGNAPKGATSTKIFHLKVYGPGWENLWLVDEPSHVLYEKNRNALPVDMRIVDEIVKAAKSEKDGVGIINALVVRRGAGDTLEIISGRQRYKAAVYAKDHYPELTILVPIRIMTLKDYVAMKATVVENEHRVGNDIVSRGEKAQRMSESGFEKDDICKAFDTEWRTIQKWIAIAHSSDPVKDAATSGIISETTALKIARKPFEEQAELVEQATANGRKKPGRKKGDNRRRIRITATQLEEGGFCLDVSKCDDVELACVIEALDAELQNRREQCTENMTQKK